MTAFAPIETLSSFRTPDFDLTLGDETAPDKRLRFDVTQVSFTDSMDAHDSFDLTLLDWDPVRRTPVYSAPWDESGVRVERQGGGGKVPILAPGTPLSLRIFYRDGRDAEASEPTLMLRGQIVSLSTSFPATGVPMATVRVLSPLADLGRKKLENTVAGRRLDIVAEVCSQMGLDLDLSGVSAPIRAAEMNKTEPVNNIDGKDPNAVLRAQLGALGLLARVVQAGGAAALVVSPPPDEGLSLVWGRTLTSFAPRISTSGIKRVVSLAVEDIQAANEAGQKAREGHAFLDLPGLDKDVLGPGVLTAIVEALDETAVPIDRPTALQKADPEQAIQAVHREAAQGIVTGSGQTLGTPRLRKGTMLDLQGLGPQFSGRWQVTKSTHAIGASGYTTSFDARKEIVDG